MMTTSQKLPHWVADDFSRSAVSPELVAVNVAYLEGRDALYAFNSADRECYHTDRWGWTNWAQKSPQAQAIAKGCWLAVGVTPGGEPGQTAYAKPLHPQRDITDKGVKQRKYESPPKAPATPILPAVDGITAEWIFERHNVEPLPGETFWQTVKRCKIPVAIVEGFKKALSLLSHGIPAIALRGVCNWHKQGQISQFHELIDHFVQSEQVFYICFDQDEKLITRKMVGKQVRQLSEQLERRGCKPSVLEWKIGLGKGIDDVLFGLGREAQTWLDQLVQSAPTFKEWRSDSRVRAAIAQIKRLSALTVEPERETTGDYLPELPPLQTGSVHVLDADMNAGKTTRIGEDWVQSAVAEGLHVLVLTPINNLGIQTASNWGLPHIHEFGRNSSGERALWGQVAQRRGLVCCPDSLGRVPAWFWRKPLVLVLDEAEQVVKHMVGGDTLKNRQSHCLELFAQACHQAASQGAIILSESGVSDRCVNFVQVLTGVDCPVRVFRHKKQSAPWNCSIVGESSSGYRALLMEAIAAGQRILFVTTSQLEGRKLDLALQDRGVRVTRIDSETNEAGQFTGFFQAPDEWLEVNQPDVLILSPSAKSGVSVQGGVSPENAYFDSVWGYFTALDTTTQMQLLGRYRPPVPRFIFVPKFVRPGADEELLSSRAVKRRLRKTALELGQVYQVARLIELGQRPDDDHFSRVEKAAIDYYADDCALIGSQKSIARTALTTRLEQAGHQIQTLRVAKSSDLSGLWEALQERCWEEDAQAIAACPVEHDEVWAIETLNSNEATHAQRLEARKILWRAEFPGVDFNDYETCYHTLTWEYGAVRTGVLLQANALNVQATQQTVGERLSEAASDLHRFAHRLPRRLHQATLLAKSGVLELIASGKRYSNSSPQAIAIHQNCLRFANDIKYFLRLQISDNHTPVMTVGKLLNKLALDGVAVERPGQRGKRRDRVYEVSGQDKSLRVQLLEAALRRLAESVSTTRKEEETLLQVVDTPPTESAPPQARAGEIPPEWSDPAALADVREWLALPDLDVRESLLSLVPRAVLDFVQRLGGQVPEFAPA